MRFIKVVTINKSRSGFSLIEIANAVAIICILMVSVLAVYTSFTRDYRKKVLVNREEFYAEEAMRFIETEIVNGNKNVNVASNVVELTRMKAENASVEVDYIKRDGSNLVIVYTKGGYYQATNVFLRNIEDFMVIRDNGVIVVEIVNNKGNRYKKCVNTRYVGLEKVVQLYT